MAAPIRAIARAVILEDDLVLLCQLIGYDNTFLPGGHVELHESCQQALEREIDEELGCPCQVGDYLGAIEHCWTEDDTGREHYEINHYFTVSIAGIASGNSPPACEHDHRFFWARLDDLERHHLRPAPLAGLLRRYQSGMRSPWRGTTLS